MTTNPSTRDEWLSLIKQEDVSGDEIMLSSERQFKSASQCDIVGFLLMRVLWRTGPVDFQFSRFFSKKVIERARKLVDDNGQWQRYIENLPQKKGRRTANEEDIGLFTLVRWQQLAINSVEVGDAVSSSITPLKRMLERVPEGDRAKAEKSYMLRKPSETVVYRQPRSESDRSSNDSSGDAGSSDDPTYITSDRESDGSSPKFTAGEKPEDLDEVKPADDEQIVNQALISLLDAIMVSSPGGSGLEASSKRKRFRYSDLWTAVTDGYLRRVDDVEGVNAIIEVKAARRLDNPTCIQWQEAGEMVAWIFRDTKEDGEYPLLGEASTLEGHKYWRLLVAQDRDQLWLVLSTYDDHYKNYLRDGKVHGNIDTESFMTMTQHGPFDMSLDDDMQAFAHFIQAFCLLTAGEVEQPMEDPPVGASRKQGSLTRRFEDMSLKDKTTRTPARQSGSSESSFGNDSSPTRRR